MTIQSVIDPNLPIIDSHHHLWKKSPPYGGRAERSYWFDEFRADINRGHNVIATVYVECHNGYRINCPDALRPVGETEMVISETNEAGPLGVCAGIVAFADLLLGDAVIPVLEAHLAAGGRRVKGIRHSLIRDDDPIFARLAKTPVGMTYSQPFRAAFSQLATFGLVFDATVFHTQLKELKDLAQAFPDTPIILSHAGGRIGIGNYAHHKTQVDQELRAGLIALAACPNVYVKLGGLGMFLGGSPLLNREPEAAVEDIAAEWMAIIEFCIEQFGVNRCMFESNFPVDYAMCSYGRLWNVFKYLTRNYSQDERSELFSGTASKVYNLPLPSAQ